MLMNNLDPEVGERPVDLVVYGGTGKAARCANWKMSAATRGMRCAAAYGTLERCRI